MVRKQIVALALAAVLLATANPGRVSAAEITTDALLQTTLEQTATSRWASTSMVVPSISISGKKISVSVVIAPKSQTASSRGTLYLEKKSGSKWITVTSWSINGTGTISMTKTYRGTSGVTYRTRVIATTGEDKIDAKSTERTV